MLISWKYFVDALGFVWRLNEETNMASMWKPLSVAWTPEKSKDEWMHALGNTQFGEWQPYTGDMPEGSVEGEEKHTCVFPLANAFNNWTGTWCCTECLTAYSWIKGCDENNVWLDWTCHGHSDMLTGLLK